MTRLRAVSLFSNCGAGDVGYRNAGFSFDVMAELEPKRLAVCLLNHPGAAGIPGDLRKTWPKVIRKYREIAGNEAPSLLCACPPCQGMSSARAGLGKHDDAEAGSKDERNLLVTVVAKVALTLNPKIIVVENVPAFLSKKVVHPRDKKPVSAANYLISRLREQYVVFPLIANLCDFGIPQSRNRAFLTLVRRDLAGLKELIHLGSAPYPRPTHGEGIGEKKHISILQALEHHKLPSLDAAKPETASVPGYGGLHSIPVWNERIYAMVAAIPAGSGRSAWESDTCLVCGTTSIAEELAVCSSCSNPLPRPLVRKEDGSYRLVKGFKTSYRRMHPDRPAATVTTASGHIGSDYTIHPVENRLLSALECAYLQTFPNDFQWGDTLEKYGHSTVREMIGEAVPPAFTKLHGEVLYEVLYSNCSRDWMALSNERSVNAWEKLSSAAKKDGRRDPRKYFDYENLFNDAKRSIEHQLTITC